jgi:DNA topoisomerase IA
MAEAVHGADRLYLATDPDREGEGISWHIYRMLKARRALKDTCRRARGSIAARRRTRRRRTRRSARPT